MLFAVMFAFWRFMEIITLIPVMGMLAYFVDGYNSQNLLTPSYILALFIVSVLALVWAIFTLFSYHRSSSNARFVSVVDLGFVGALIAGVYHLRGVAEADCTNAAIYFSGGGGGGEYLVAGVDVPVDKTCAMLKTCFALGIVNCILFTFTALLAWIHGDHHQTAKESKSHHYHNGRRHRDSARATVDNTNGPTVRSGRSRSRGSRHGSRSRRSSYSHTRTYHV